MTLFAITRYPGLLHMRRVLKREFGKGKTGTCSERHRLFLFSVTDAAISTRLLIDRDVAGIALFVAGIVHLKDLSGHLMATVTVQLGLAGRHLFAVEVHMMEEFLDTKLVHPLRKIDQCYSCRVDRRLVARFAELTLLWESLSRKDIGMALDASAVTGALRGRAVVSALVANLAGQGLVSGAVVVEV